MDDTYRASHSNYSGAAYPYEGPYNIYILYGSLEKNLQGTLKGIPKKNYLKNPSIEDYIYTMADLINDNCGQLPTLNKKLQPQLPTLTKKLQPYNPTQIHNF
ncbi:unnamed protein product [Prunus armeniaca]